MSARTTPRRHSSSTRSLILSNVKKKEIQVPASPFEVASKKHHKPDGFCECLILRDVRSPKPRFSLTYQLATDTNGSSGKAVPAIIAEKQSSVGGNYHFFDLSRVGGDGLEARLLSKKAGNYIGKLRQDSGGASGKKKISSLAQSTITYSLYNAKEESKDILGIYQYDAPSLLSQWKEGQPPRKLRVIVASNSSDASDGECSVVPKNWDAGERRKRNGFDWSSTGNSSDDGTDSTDSSQQEVHLLRTKEPFYDAGQYRLNFNGRVTVPSVKNFQLEDDQGTIILQFGRVSDHKFHLDYRHPFSAVTAFAACLTQFDL